MLKCVACCRPLPTKYKCLHTLWLARDLVAASRLWQRWLVSSHKNHIGPRQVLPHRWSEFIHINETKQKHLYCAYLSNAFPAFIRIISFKTWNFAFIAWHFRLELVAHVYPLSYLLIMNFFRPGHYFCRITKFCCWKVGRTFDISRCGGIHSTRGMLEILFKSSLRSCPIWHSNLQAVFRDSRNFSELLVQ